MRMNLGYIRYVEWLEMGFFLVYFFIVFFFYGGGFREC